MLSLHSSSSSSIAYDITHIVQLLALHLHLSANKHLQSSS